MIRNILVLAQAVLIATCGSAFALSDLAIPTKIPTYWGTSAPGGNNTCPIPTPSQIGITAGRASWTDGFPPLTFNPVASGGIPPFGQDFNGVLCQISQWTRWYNAGAPVPYDATFQTAIGGYPSGAVVADPTVVGLSYLSLINNNTDPVASPNWVSRQWSNNAPTGPAGGDLTGTYPNPSIGEIQGIPVSASSPTLGYVLTFNGTEWVPSTPGGGPPTGAAGGDLTGSYPNPTIGNLQGKPVSASSPSPSNVLTWNGSIWVPAAPSGGPPSGAAGGDLGSTYPNPTVIAIHGYAVSAAIPQAGQTFVFNGTYWALQAGAVGTITNVIAGNGLTGGGNSGSVTLAVNPATVAQVQAGSDNANPITSLALAGAMGISKTTNGYQKLSTGLIIQWGTASIGTGGSAISFPIVFPTALVNVQATPVYASASAYATVSSSGISTSGVTFYGSITTSIYWFAIGY